MILLNAFLVDMLYPRTFKFAHHVSKVILPSMMMAVNIIFIKSPYHLLRINLYEVNVITVSTKSIMKKTAAVI